jgi:DNA-binding CsgD family transcriptional regulator
VVASAHGQLQITVLTHPHTGMRFLSLEEKRGRKLAGGGMISAREQEVLEWLQVGKSNAEIALILGISEHTVRHHVERIFSKLGFENRRAAMLCAQQPSQSPLQRFLSHTSRTVLS